MNGKIFGIPLVLIAFYLVMVLSILVPMFALNTAVQTNINMLKEATLETRNELVKYRQETEQIRKDLDQRLNEQTQEEVEDIKVIPAPVVLPAPIQAETQE